MYTSAAPVIPGFATHLDVLWELPELAAFMDRLGRFGRAGTYHDQESNRAAAGLIPNGTFVLLPGADTLPYLGDADAVLDEIEEFLTGAHGTADFDRSLATVLFTDIVGSTQAADQLGDRKGRRPR